MDDDASSAKNLIEPAERGIKAGYGTITPSSDGTASTTKVPENEAHAQRVQHRFARHDGNILQRALWWCLTPPPVPEERRQSGQHSANFLSTFFFTWPFHTIWAATTRQLEINDIDRIDPRRTTGTKSDQFLRHLHGFAAAKSAHPLLRAMMATYRKKIVMAVLVSLLSVAADLGIVYFLRVLGKELMAAYAHAGSRHDPWAPDLAERFPLWKVVVQVFYIALVVFSNAILRTHANYQMTLVGGEFRMVLASCMYVKAMHVSRTAIRPSAKETGGQDGDNWASDDEDDFVELEDVQDCCNPTPASSAKTRTRARRASKTRKNQQETTAKAASKTASDVYWTEGPIINSMSVDTRRIEDFVSIVHHMLISIAGAACFFPVAWYIFSWPGIVGGLLRLIELAATSWVASMVSGKRRFINRLAERRANLLLDMLQGVRFLKVFGWEQVFLERFHRVRASEARRLKGVQVATLFGFSVSFGLGRGSLLIANVLYRYFVGDLSVVYNVVAFQTMLENFGSRMRWARNVSVAAVIAWPSIKNVQDLLLAEDHDTGHGIVPPSDPYNAIELDKAQFSWSRADKKSPQAGGVSNHGAAATAHNLVQQQGFVLHPLTLTLGHSELVAVVGPVACGKSSLAAGIVGEMIHIGGRVAVDRPSVGYCPQSAWIQNATVQENITFGLEYDEERYNRIISACQLDRDIETAFPNGAATELGEQGITISGGQKARIQLARIMYRQPGVVILDDPLSAVDARTSRHIFERAILEEMAGTCRILITHQLHVISRCDRIVWMEDGKIMAVGTYETLMATQPAFAKWVGKAASSHSKKQDKSSASSSETTPSGSSTNLASSAGSFEEQEPVKADEQQDKASSTDSLMVAEERASGDVPWSLYWKYATLANSVALVLFHYGTLVFSQVVNMVYHVGVPWWSARQFDLPDWAYPTIIGGSITLHAISWGYFYVECQNDLIKSSRAMVGGAIERLFRAPLSFFDTTPMGRLLNRFTQDVSTMDMVLPFNTWSMSLCFFALVSVAGMIGMYIPASLVVFVPWVLLIWAILWLYKRSPLSLERLEKLRQSQFMAKLAEGVNGRSVLVACGRVPDFTGQLYSVIDELNSIHFTGFAADAWVKTNSCLVTILLTVAIGILVGLLRFSLHPALALWCVIVCPQFNSYMSSSFEDMARVQHGMTAVQRLEHYRTELPDEGPRHLPPDLDAAGSSWPLDGSIEIKDVNMRYRDGLPLSIAGLSLRVKSGEKIGIVGRTGAGKSSLAAILLRTVNVESGTITISGVDTAHVGLHPLRRAIAVIPQDPTLFLGTIRRNLDPSARDVDPDPAHDARLESALRAVRLMHHHHHHSSSSSSPDSTTTDSRTLTLDSRVEIGGRNFSHGDRQLLALARALLRPSPILLIDEATSAVDPARDAHIQQTIRREFSSRTVLAIAHRIGTILPYDKVAVMDQGRVVEFGPPRELWLREGGVFRGLCDASRITEQDFASREG